MHTKRITFSIAIIFCAITSAQQKDQVLLTISKTPVYTSEFKKVYLKNIDLVTDESQKDIDQYLKLFINYKLKLKEALALGLDKREAYIKELKGYEKQLSSRYLTDSKVSEALVKEAYDRLQERVHASHILIQMKPNASPQDTLAAYQKITTARNMLLQGEDFGLIARRFSEDPSVEKNEGDLGWFSAFRMVYPFENAAYKTKVGDVSAPFKTRFGYHILQVKEKEKTLGEITVAHIMVVANKERTEKEAVDRIHEIDLQLKQKVPFESLAKEYSDDRNTAINGGKINRFVQGALNSEKFEKAAFALQNPGEISGPVKTKYGWHIIKLIEKHPIKSFEELKSELAEKIKKDERSQIITDAFIHTLKKEYGVTKNEEAIQYFKKHVPATIFKEGLAIDPNDPSLEKQVFSIRKENFLYKDFAKFLNKKSKNNKKYTDISTFVDTMYDAYESSILLQYHEEHLEENNQEFANVISEYRNGLLLFDLMETKVWNAAKKDSMGLKKFYEANKNNYIQKEIYKVTKASSSKKKLIDKVKVLMEKGMPIDAIKKEVNISDNTVVLFSEEDITKEKDLLANKLSGKKGEILMSHKDGYATVIKVNEIAPSRLKTFEETKGAVMNDFQENLEKIWLAQLREKYTVEINKRTLKKIKKDLSI